MSPLYASQLANIHCFILTKVYFIAPHSLGCVGSTSNSSFIFVEVPLKELSQRLNILGSLS